MLPATRLTQRSVTHFVTLPSRKLVVGVVGVTPGKLQGEDSGQEALELYKHFAKSDLAISHVCLGLFDDDVKELRSRVDRKIKKVDSVDKLPSSSNRHFLQLAQQATINQVPVVPVARHRSHTFVRTSWMLWDHRDERHRLLCEIVSLRKIFTPHAYKFFDQVAPHVAYALYHEPARFAVLKTLKYADESVATSRAVLLAVPEHLVVPVMRVFQDERTGQVIDEDLNVLQAAGYSYWPILFLGYFAVPLLSVSLALNYAEKRLHIKDRLFTGGLDPQHVKIEGTFGSRWARDTRRD